MIANNEHSGKLTELQISLLRLFDQRLDPQQTIEVRLLLLNYFSTQLTNEVNQVVEEKEYTDEDFRRMLVDDNFPAIRKQIDKSSH